MNRRIQITLLVFLCMIIQASVVRADLDGAAVKKAGGLFGNKAVYIPDRSYKDALAGIMKTEVAKDEIPPLDIALVSIKRTKTGQQASLGLGTENGLL